MSLFNIPTVLRFPGIQTKQTNYIWKVAHHTWKVFPKPSLDLILSPVVVAGAREEREGQKWEERSFFLVLQRVAAVGVTRFPEHASLQGEKKPFFFS